MKKPMKKIALLAFVLSSMFSLTGCATLLGLLPFPIPGIGSGGGPSGEEQSMLYAKGVRAMMPDPMRDLQISKDERVWVVNKNGGTNTDSAVDGLTYDAIIDTLRGKGISEVVARDDDMMRSLYVEYTESAKLAARDDSLARDGKMKPADVILTYRLMRHNVRQPGYIILGLRFIVGGCIGLVTDAQPNVTDGLRLLLHVEVIDVKTGTTRATRVIEHVERQPDWFAADFVMGEYDGR